MTIRRKCSGKTAVKQIAGLVLSLSMLGAQGFAQPCNPAIDGTYCALEPPRRDVPSRPAVTMSPIQSLAGDLSLNQSRDQPATLGAISFQGGSRCVGLLRRAACN
jgi:hypothetical protein